MTEFEKMQYDMLRIRMIEEEIASRYPEGKMRCPVHLSVGQEAPAVGICAGLSMEDKMVSTHRSHAHYLAKGGSLKGLLGELYGKSTGCSRGNGGSMHLIDISCNFYGSTSIVGGTIPVGVGLSFSDRLNGSKAKTVVCIGDAAIEEGVFHEALNFTSLHKLNVIFAVENNGYSCYTPIEKRQPRVNFQALAKGYGITYKLCLYAKDIQKAVKTINAPLFIEMPTCRYLQHCGPDNDDSLGYRDLEEVLVWKKIDQVVRHPEWSIKIATEIDEAFEHAENAPYPDEREVGAYVYKTTDVQRQY